MEWVLRSIAEEKIAEAIREGAFENLPGFGRPLKLDDDSWVPEDLRAAFRLLKNAGLLPEEMQLRKEMVTLERLIACCTDERQRHKLKEEWSAKHLRYRMLAESRGWPMNGAFAEYEHKIRERLTDGNGSGAGAGEPSGG